MDLDYILEIKLDNIPIQVNAQALELIDKFSKLDTCKNSFKTNSVFHVTFMSQLKAKKSLGQIVELLQSNWN